MVRAVVGGDLIEEELEGVGEEEVEVREDLEWLEGAGEEVVGVGGGLE